MAAVSCSVVSTRYGGTVQVWACDGTALWDEHACGHCGGEHREPGSSLGAACLAQMLDYGA